MSNKSNLLTKELVNTFLFSDIHTDREDSMNTVIDGRDCVLMGTRTATTLVGNLYQLDLNVEPNKYLLLVGVARQSVTGFGITEEAAEELANTNAFVNPMLTMYLDNPIDEESFECLGDLLVHGGFLQKKFLLTPEEMEKYGL